MARTKLMAGIETISGTLRKEGGLRTVCRTYTRPDGTKETRVYLVPESTYPRKTPLSKDEQANRVRFTSMVAEVNRRWATGKYRTKKAVWAEVKREMKSN